MNQVIKLCKLWIPVLLWAGIIFYLSSKPRMNSGLEEVESGLLDLILRKCAHVFEYFTLTCLLYRAIKGTFVLKQTRILIYTGIIAIIYSCLDEYHQTFIPTRTGSIYDVMVDSMGVLMFLIIIMSVQLNKSKEGL